jgi:hypothetical protein
LVARKAPWQQIEAHPLIQRAYKRAQSLPRTETMPGYGTPDWKENREFNLSGRKAVGYKAAQDYLTQQAVGTQDRQGAWPYGAAIDLASRRRGDRINGWRQRRANAWIERMLSRLSVR